MEQPFSLISPMGKCPDDIKIIIAKYTLSGNTHDRTVKKFNTHFTGSTLDRAVTGIKKFFIASPGSRKNFAFNKAILEHLIKTDLISNNADLLKTVRNLNRFPAFKDSQMQHWIFQQMNRLKKESELRTALKTVDIIRVRSLCATSNLNFNAVAEQGKTLLEDALDATTAKTLDDTMKIVSLLIEKGANVNKVRVYGSPLISAIDTGHPTLVKLLLDNKADPNKFRSSNSPLHGLLHSPALEFCDFKKIITLLLEANINIVDIIIGRKTLLRQIEIPEYKLMPFNLFDSMLSVPQKEEIIDLFRKYGAREL
jgi:hypothetical protein